jgi:hypothetical protein
VIVSAREKKGWLYLSVDDPSRFEVYDTSIRRDSNGNLFAYIHEVRTAAGQGGQGLGVEAFVRQVAGARALGVRYFKLWAAGDYFAKSRNGYYTWARFGFEAPLMSHQKGLLTDELADAETVNDVIRMGGENWWRRYGGDAEMLFDLSDESEMMALFKRYLREKKIFTE